MSTESSELAFGTGATRRTLQIMRHPKSRGLRLRVDPRDGRVLLTMPQRGSLRRAHKWVETQRGWIESEIAKVPEPHPIKAGGTIPFRGADLGIDWNEMLSRAPKLDGAKLRIGGPESALSRRVIQWLKDEARRSLQEETYYYAKRANVRIDRVSIGDARTRWGSCSSSGRIRYNWRLIMAPADVLTATVAHEVAHRVHMDHSPEFHGFVEKLLGKDPNAERRWLRENGAALYRVGCSS